MATYLIPELLGNGYTIIRPAITYSKRILQLITLGASVLAYRMIMGKTVVLPESAMDKQATMTWREIAEIYKEVGGLEYITVDDDTYIQLVAGDGDWAKYARQQLTYDRCFDRIVDNSKTLALMGAKQEKLMPIREGLKREFSQMI